MELPEPERGKGLWPERGMDCSKGSQRHSWRMLRKRTKCWRDTGWEPREIKPWSGGTPWNAAREKQLARTSVWAVRAARGDPGDAMEGSMEEPPALLGNAAGGKWLNVMESGEGETLAQPGASLEK